MVDPLGSRYPTDASLLQFFEAIEHEVDGAPGRPQHGVDEHVAAGPVRSAVSVPSKSRETLRSTSGSVRPPTTQIVSPDYFRTLDLPVVAGRGFNDRDRADSVPVCMVNEAFVRGYCRRPIADRPAGRAPARRVVASAAGGPGDRRRRPPGQGPA